MLDQNSLRRTRRLLLGSLAGAPALFALRRELHIIMRQAGTADLASINQDHLAWPKV
jgi:hypothetical protein